MTEIKGLRVPPDGYEWAEIIAVQVNCLDETPPKDWYYLGILRLQRVDGSSLGPMPDELRGFFRKARRAS